LAVRQHLLPLGSRFANQAAICSAARGLAMCWGVAKR
jgi:hypothetical protein